MAELTDIRESVRQRYASAANAAARGEYAGALTETEFRALLAIAGFDEIQTRPTHRVHQHASSAIIHAHKPVPTDCCSAAAQANCCETAAKAECCSEAHAPGACGCQASASSEGA